MIIPWNVDVPQDRYPVGNWLIIGVILLVFVLQIAAVAAEINKLPEGRQNERVESFPGAIGTFVLDGWSIPGLFGHMWLHSGVMHIIGNLLFLWIFGNAVCAKIGSKLYIPLYILFGLIAAVAHLVFEGGKMVGASGAIYGVVGMFLVFFPRNDITCYFFILLPFIWKEFTLSSYWMILFWVAFDVFGAMFCTSVAQVAYFAHVGGFVAGFAVAVVLLKTAIVAMEPRYEESLLQVLGRWGKPPEPMPGTGMGDYRLYMDLAAMEQERPEPMPQAPPAAASEVAPERRVVIDDAPAQYVRFVCSCGKKVKIAAEHAGKSGRCPQCKKRIQIPRADSGRP